MKIIQVAFDDIWKSFNTWEDLVSYVSMNVRKGVVMTFPNDTPLSKGDIHRLTTFVSSSISRDNRRVQEGV